MSDDNTQKAERPEHVLELTLGRTSSDRSTKITLDGIDITSGLRGIALESTVGRITTATLDMVPHRIHAVLLNPHIQRATWTPEECARLLREYGWTANPPTSKGA